MVKSQLSPRSGSVALRQLNPIHIKGPESFFFNFEDKNEDIKLLNIHNI